MLATMPRLSIFNNRPSTSGGTSPTVERPAMEFGDFSSMWTAGDNNPRNTTYTATSSHFSPSDTAALNAAIYGYGGHGALTPSGGVPPTIRFWDEETIDEVVTKDYIRAQFSERHRKRLEEQIDASGELTESTFVEWIHERMRRVFLILLETGAKEKIFDMVEGSLDDSDLPLSTLAIARLNFGSSLEKKFYKKQYEVLVKSLEKGDYIEYFDDEIVPLDVTERKPTTSSAGMVLERVVCRKKRSNSFIRIKMPIPKSEQKRQSCGTDDTVKSFMMEDPIAKQAFLEELNFHKQLDHKHVQSFFAAYTHQEFGYILLTPQTDLSLKQFIQNPSLSFKNMEKPMRRNTIIRWLHCMIAALNYLQSKGISHHNISPRNVMITSNNNIVLVDITRPNKNVERESPSADIEAYEYGAPEHWKRTLANHEPSSSCSSTNTSGARSHRVESPSSTSPSSSLQVSSWTQRGISEQTTYKPPIFSLGAIFLDLLTFALKRKPSAFSAHRSAKNHRPRVSGRPDASFHSNLSQVESWIDLLEKDAKKKTWIAAREALATVRYMLVKDPIERIAGSEVERQIRRIVELEGIEICKCSRRLPGLEEMPRKPNTTLRTGKSTASSRSLRHMFGWESEAFMFERNGSDRLGWVEENIAGNRSSRGTTLSSNSRSSKVGWAM